VRRRGTSSKCASGPLRARSRRGGLEGNQFRTPPPWLTLQSDTLRGTVSRLPSPEEMQPGVNVQLIVEFYSR